MRQVSVSKMHTHTCLLFIYMATLVLQIICKYINHNEQKGVGTLQVYPSSCFHACVYTFFCILFSLSISELEKRSECTDLHPQLQAWFFAPRFSKTLTRLDNGSRHRSRMDRAASLEPSNIVGISIICWSHPHYLGPEELKGNLIKINDLGAN